VNIAEKGLGSSTLAPRYGDCSPGSRRQLQSRKVEKQIEKKHKTKAKQNKTKIWRLA